MRNLVSKLAAFGGTLLLVACATPPGSYRVTATAKDGKPITGSTTADARGLSVVRNGTCLANPGAVLKIVDATTGQEVAGESPYRCP